MSFLVLVGGLLVKNSGHGPESDISDIFDVYRRKSINNEETRESIHSFRFTSESRMFWLVLLSKGTFFRKGRSMAKESEKISLIIETIKF